MVEGILNESTPPDKFKTQGLPVIVKQFLLLCKHIAFLFSV